MLEVTSDWNLVTIEHDYNNLPRTKFDDFNSEIDAACRTTFMPL
jgi:hypothetical protein